MIVFCYLWPFVWGILFPICSATYPEVGPVFLAFPICPITYAHFSPQGSLFSPATVVQCSSLMIGKDLVCGISNKRKQVPEEQTTALCSGTSSPFIKPSRTMLRVGPKVLPCSSGACFLLCEILDTDYVFTRLPVEVSLHENIYNILQAYGRSCSH